MNTSLNNHKESLRGPSPTKQAWRPSTGYRSPNKRASYINQSILQQTESGEVVNSLTGSVFTYPTLNIIKELNGKEIVSQDKDIEIERLKTTCFNLNNKTNVTEDLLQDIQLLNARLQEAEQARQQLENQNHILENSNRTLTSENQTLENQNRAITKQNQGLEDQNRALDNQVNGLQDKNRAQYKEIQSFETQTRTLEKELTTLRSDLQSTLQVKSQMQKDLDAAADFNITMEEKVYKSNKISLDLIQQLKIAEMELGYIYVPVQKDAIDVRLAEYINWSTARPALKSLFTRESEGVYQFGSKRCNIKVDQNKIFVRVGGGYLMIDEFVDQYLPIELEKIGSKMADYRTQYVPEVVRQSQLNPNVSIRKSSPVRNASPNTRMSTSIRQSVSLKYI